MARIQSRISKYFILSLQAIVIQNVGEEIKKIIETKEENKEEMFSQIIEIYLSGNQVKQAADFAKSKGKTKLSSSLVFAIFFFFEFC